MVAVYQVITRTREATCENTAIVVQARGWEGAQPYIYSTRFYIKQIIYAVQPLSVLYNTLQFDPSVNKMVKASGVCSQ